MYFCYTHNWGHAQYSCPQCHKEEPLRTFTSAGTMTLQIETDEYKVGYNAGVFDSAQKMQRIKDQYNFEGNSLIEAVRKIKQLETKVKELEESYIENSVAYGEGIKLKDNTISELQSKLKTAEDKILSIIARSHSWVMKEETAYIEKPIHDSYRRLAQDAIKDISIVKEREDPNRYNTPSHHTYCGYKSCDGQWCWEQYK